MHLLPCVHLRRWEAPRHLQGQVVIQPTSISKYLLNIRVYSGIFRFYFASCCDIGQDEDDIDVISNPVFEPIEAEEEDNFIDEEGIIIIMHFKI